MFSVEIIEMLKQVITSWQVIAVTIGIILYLNIVFYTARSYHRPKVKKEKVKKQKPEPEAVPEEIESDSNDELGLEEA
ncbi:MAG: hypothetical protein LBH16_02880 [Treponema sp.]|jgi:hypothetical protein|nr:hypothetical protein [Treponema sp.]